MAASDIRKAAILLMSLPQDQAAMLLGKLEAKQVETVSIEIAKINGVSGDEQETTIQEFASANPTALTGSSGGLDVARNLVQQALGKGASSTLENVRQSIEALPFGFLQKVDSQNLLTFIIDEHPQTIALILSHLPPAQASDIISGLPAERQMSVIRRVATMGQTSPEIIQEVDPDLVEEIRRLMFVFEDITKLSDRDIQSLLKNVESSQWAMALKGASEELKDKILNNMSKRASDLLMEEIEYLGPVRLSNVEQTQQQIVDIVRRLEDAGELTTHGDEEEEQFIQ